MGSTFSWLDHSDKERRQVLDAIDRFKETFTRDELGLANIRDGFSNLFFPGTSVLMTRARYFLFVPWAYLEIERRGWRDDVSTRLRRAEVQLIDTLGDLPGNIGRLAKGTLKRMPSSIYWLGLESWGIRTTKSTRYDFHRVLERDDSRKVERTMLDDDGERVDDRGCRHWNAGLPKAPDGFPKQAALELSKREAEYLRERIILSRADSMLALIVKAGVLPDVDYAWLHPELDEFPAGLRTSLQHARNFAEAMHGAALLYNVMLAAQGKRDTIADYHKWMHDWASDLSPRIEQLRE